MLTIARVLLTLGILCVSVNQSAADLNRTHAKNPLWTKHARFHVVWQSMSYLCVGLIALALTWWPGSREIARVVLAAGLAACIYLGFLLAALERRLFGTSFYDENGYRPWPVRIGTRTLLLDGNAVVFPCMFLVTIVAAVLAAAS